MSGLTDSAYEISGSGPHHHSSRLRQFIRLPKGAGASEHELMAMFGWEDADMARVYTRKTAQKKLAVSSAAKVAHRVTIVPPTVPPLGMVSKKQHVRSWMVDTTGIEPVTLRV